MIAATDNTLVVVIPPGKTGKLKKETKITIRNYANSDNGSLPDKFHQKLSTGTESTGEAKWINRQSMTAITIRKYNP